MRRSSIHRSPRARTWSLRWVIVLAVACDATTCEPRDPPLRVVDCPRFVASFLQQPQSVTAPVGGVARFEGEIVYLDEPGTGFVLSWQRGGSAAGPWEAVTQGVSTPPGAPYRRILDVVVTPELAGWFFRLQVRQQNTDEPAHCRDPALYTLYSTPARLDLSVPPQITQHPQSRTVTVGDPVTFTVVASGSELTYQWQKNGADIATAGTGNAFVIPTAALADAGEYRVIVTNVDQLSDASDVAVLTVQPLGGTVITWTGGAGTTDWFTAGNWDLARVPASTDSVIIADAAAEVDVRRSAFEAFDVTVGALWHTAGTLRVVGPSNCPNCSIFRVERAIASTGAATLVETGHARLIVGAGSEIAHLREVFEADMVLRTTLEGPAGGSASLAVGRLEGNPVIDRLSVTVTDTAQFDGGVHVVDGMVTIAAGAGAGVASPRVGAEAHFVGPMTVAGRLHAQGYNGVEFRGPVVVTTTGLIEFGFTRFDQGLTLAGELRGVVGAVPSSVLFFDVSGRTVTIEASGELAADDIAFHAPTILHGQLRAGRVQASPSHPTYARPFTASATATLAIDQLHLGPAGTTIAVSGALFGVDSLVSLSAMISLEGTGTLTMRYVDAQGTTFRGNAPGPVAITADSVRLRGNSLVPTLLNAVALTIVEWGQLENPIQGLAGARMILPGAISFIGANIAPATAGVPGALYVEHLGTFRGAFAASTITACIVTGPVAQILPPLGAATLTLIPLSAGECP